MTRLYLALLAWLVLTVAVVAASGAEVVEQAPVIEGVEAPDSPSVDIQRGNTEAQLPAAGAAPAAGVEQPPSVEQPAAEQQPPVEQQ
jgi:hypothetical protein